VTVSRPPVLAEGHEVLFRGAVHTVAALTGPAVRLVDVTGTESVVALTVLFTDPGFSVVTPSLRRAALPPQGILEGLPDEVVEQARWWEQHIVEVLSGRPPEADRRLAVRPQYDPQTRTLRQREIAKVAELEAGGQKIALSTFQRLRQRYEAQGLWGLVDGRVTRRRATGVDDRVVEAVRQAVAEETDRSTGTVGRLQRRVEQILVVQHSLEPSSVMPSRATFYRLVERISAGKHTFGSARTRRSLAKRPSGPFGAVGVVRPGEWLQIDSTPLDVRVVLDGGLVDRVELTWMIDLATRTIPAAVLRPTTKAVDAALLLARSLTPEPMRPGWTDALRMSRSVLPHRRLVEIDERLRDAAARPVIVPETIVCDHGMVYVSQTFRSACRAMGINFQTTHKASPWEKGAVERSFNSIDTLFAQHVAGYVGNSVEHRGQNAEQTAVWSILELQELLDEWIVAFWQNRPHDGLRHPVTPGCVPTPNEQYAALVETTGYVPVPLTADDYIELLPITWRAINSYGVKIRHRRYDTKALNPYRRQHSGVAARKGLWEVHYDPYDVTRIWIRDHHDGGWITAPWTHLHSAPAPFGDQAWRHAQQIVARRGGDPTTEHEVAQAVAALLDRAEEGPVNDKEPSTADKKVAARTRATVTQTWPRPESPPVESEQDEAADDEDDAQELAQVIPLGIFDAREEAKKWW